MSRLLVALCLVVGALGCQESQAAGGAGPAKASVGACGDKDLPDCPLQTWMKSTVRTYLNANDMDRLAGALEQLAEKEPQGYTGWRESSLAAAKAARSGNVPAAKAECKRCHDQLRNRFRKEHRGVSLF
jgi:hypothetical protein